MQLSLLNTSLTKMYGGQGGGQGFGSSLNLDFTSGSGLDPRITFTRASTATRTNAAGLIESVAANQPRFDYDPVTLQPKGLLIEEQRTNLLTYSEQFDNAAWVTSGRVTITANQTTAPDGTITSDKLTETIDTGTHRVWYTINYNPNTTYTASVYFKKGTRRWTFMSIQTDSTPTTQIQQWFDLDNGILGSNGIGAGGTEASRLSASISNIGDGWYRCSLVVGFGGTVSNGISRGFYTGISNADGVVVYAGSTSDYNYIWGAQLEAGAFPTSYIPTTSAQATRAADVASMTESNFSSWYRADEGTLFAEYTVSAPRSSDFTVFKVSDGTSSNQIQTGTGSSATIFNSFIISGGVSQGNNLVSSSPVGNEKVSFSYAANSSVTSANSLIGTTDSTVSVPAGINQAMFGRDDSAGYINGHIKRLAYYPRRLANAELQALTA